MNLFQDLTALLASLKATPFSAKAVWKAFLKVANDLDAFIGPGPAVFAAKPGEDVAALVQECIDCCNCHPGFGAEAPTVGKLGDGTMLAAILKFLILIAPLFIEPQPA